VSFCCVTVLIGSESVLPTILYLTTGVLKQLAPRGAAGVLSPVVSTALQCLKALCSSPLSRDPRCADGWKRNLQSALATILEFANPGYQNWHGLFTDLT
jgi:HEAT repeat-containing protein 5